MQLNTYKNYSGKKNAQLCMERKEKMIKLKQYRTLKEPELCMRKQERKDRQTEIQRVKKGPINLVLQKTSRNAQLHEWKEEIRPKAEKKADLQKRIQN